VISDEWGRSKQNSFFFTEVLDADYRKTQASFTFIQIRNAGGSFYYWLLVCTLNESFRKLPGLFERALNFRKNLMS
jgi:hypothetical protein